MPETVDHHHPWQMDCPLTNGRPSEQLITHGGGSKPCPKNTHFREAEALGATNSDCKGADEATMRGAVPSTLAQLHMPRNDLYVQGSRIRTS